MAAGRSGGGISTGWRNCPLLDRCSAAGSTTWVSPGRTTTRPPSTSSSRSTNWPPTRCGTASARWWRRWWRAAGAGSSTSATARARSCPPRRSTATRRRAAWDCTWWPGCRSRTAGTSTAAASTSGPACPPSGTASPRWSEPGKAKEAMHTVSGSEPYAWPPLPCGVLREDERQAALAVAGDLEGEVDPVEVGQHALDVGRQVLARRVELVQLGVRGARDVEHRGEHVHDLVQRLDHHAGQLAVLLDRVLAAAGGQQGQRTTGVGGGGEVHHAQGVDGHRRVDVDRHGHRLVRRRRDRATGVDGHRLAQQTREHVADVLGGRQGDGGHAIPPSRASLNVSSLNGLAMRNRAPALAALSRISGEPSEVTKPNGTSEPEERSACRHSIPVMLGMFQSESTRSGFSEPTLASASAPSSASTISWSS